MKKQQVPLSVGQLWRWVRAYSVELVTSPVPETDRITLVLEDMETDVRRKKERYHDALREVNQVQSTEVASQGSLPQAKARLRQYDEQGAKWGRELRDPNLSADRKAQLEERLRVCSAECSELEVDINHLETLLTSLTETMTVCKATYTNTKAEYDKVKRMAPALLQQAQALEQAEADKLAALQAAEQGGNAVVVESLLTSLTERVEAASAGVQAAETIAGEEEEIDLDSLIADEGVKHDTDARMQRWMSE